jgi:hypothetical protein
VARVGFTTATLVLEADRAGINQSTPLEPYDVCFAEKHSGTRHKKSTCNTKKKVIFLEALASKRQISNRPANNFQPKLAVLGVDVG